MLICCPGNYALATVSVVQIESVIRALALHRPAICLWLVLRLGAGGHHAGGLLTVMR